MINIRPNILVADDDAALLRLITATLGGEYDIQSVCTADQCISHLHNAPVIPDILLLDVNMPGANGFEICKSLRQSGRYNDMSIVFISGKQDIGAKLRGYDVGGDDYLTKPIDLSELRAKVRKKIVVRDKHHKRIKQKTDHAKWCMDFALSHPLIGVWEASRDSGRMEWDKRMAELYQLPEGVLVQSWADWLQRIIEADRGRVARLFEAFERGEDPGVIRFQIVLSNGVKRHIECRGSHYYDQEGVWHSTIGTNRDVTDQVLSEISLKEKTKLATKALQAKTEFISCMSHEIRTPMNGVLGIIDLLSRTALDEEQREQLALAKKCGDDLVAILNDILDFSRIGDSNVSLDQIDFDLVKEVYSVVASMQKTAESKGLGFSFSIDLGQSHFVRGDPVRIKQIIHNVLDNAIKFTDSGFVKLKLALEPHDDTSEWVAFSVTDTGIGIPEDKFNHIFQMFTQVDASTTRRFGGTGLGLAIVKGLVEKMSGTIDVLSTLGKGSEFKGRILVDRVSQDVNVNHVGKADSNVFEGMKVLLVEDLEINQVVTEILLDELGIDVVIADNGQIALDVLRSDPDFDLVLMDCEMPVLDGMAATRAIRAGAAGDNYSDIPIVALTANVTLRNKSKALESGMNAYVNKPVSLEKLVSGMKPFIRTVGLGK